MNAALAARRVTCPHDTTKSYAISQAIEWKARGSPDALQPARPRRSFVHIALIVPGMQPPLARRSTPEVIAPDNAGHAICPFDAVGDMQFA
jgi:hypothetical protein